jgi:tripeptide aminopeptidase
MVLAKMLAEEMKQIGLQDISIDENGYVMATLPANISKKVPVIGFLAHFDTSPNNTAEHVNPHTFPAGISGTQRLRRANSYHH